MDDRTLQERMTALEDRLARLETRLGANEPAATAGRSAGAAEASSPTVGPAPEPAIPLSLPQAPGSPRPLPESVGTAAPPPLPASATKAAILLDLVQASRRTRPAGPSPHQGERGGGGADALEAQVGVKWVGWAGAILVAIGAALLVKYAYDRQWFGSLPPAVRLGLMSLGGLGLIAAGEVVLRRVGAVAAAGLFGAGVATLFVVSYAGFEYFDLYGRNVSFVLMALVTLAGAAVAIRGNLVSIAALSIIGGNVAPLVLAGDDAAPAPLLAYLLMLQVVALVLAWWGRQSKWWALRGLALATICLWMAVPVVGIGELPGQRGVVLAFALLYAALFHAELVLSALRPVAAPTYRTGFAVPVPLGARDGSAEQRSLGVTFGLLVTALLTVAVLLLFADAPRTVRGAWTIGLAACCLALGVVLPQLARGNRAVPFAPPLPLHALSVGYRIQAAALLVVAVPVTLSGVWVTVAWAVLGAAFAVAGAMLDLSVSRAAGVLVWMFAVAHLGAWTLQANNSRVGWGPMGATWAVLFGVPIPAFAVLALVMTLVGHGIAALVREDWSRRAVAHHPDPSATASERTRAPDGSADMTNGAHSLNYESRTAVRPVPVAGPQFQALSTVAEVVSAGVFLVAAHAALPPLGSTFAVLCYGWSMIAADRIARSPVLLPAGLLMLALAAGKWLLFDTFARWLETGQAGGRGYRPVYNPTVAVGAAVLVSGLVLWRAPLRLQPVQGFRGDKVAGIGTVERGVRAAGGFVAVLTLWWVVTLEVDRYFDLIAHAAVAGGAVDAARAKQVAVSIFWSAYAVACVGLGFRLRAAGLRYFGLALFAVAALKVLLVDLGQVQTGYRILSFLGLGLLLLGTSVLYGKLSPILLQERRADAEAPPP